MGRLVLAGVGGRRDPSAVAGVDARGPHGRPGAGRAGARPTVLGPRHPPEPPRPALAHLARADRRARGAAAADPRRGQGGPPTRRGPRLLGLHALAPGGARRAVDVHAPGPAPPGWDRRV